MKAVRHAVFGAQGEAAIVPEAWSAIDLSILRGTLLVIGASDTGKSTFAGWLFDQLVQTGNKVAFLDGDVGQSNLGPPTTLTLALSALDVPHDGPDVVRWFVGDVSPRGHMLPLVVGAGRLVQRASESGAETVVMDTTGLVDLAHGGVPLKHALVDQLQPTTLFAFQRTGELEPILAPLRRLPRPRVVELPVSDAVHQRDVGTRQVHRADAFRRYFERAGIMRLPLRGRAVFNGSVFAPRRLLALQDADGFTLALGVIVTYDEARDELDVRTPLTKPERVASIQLGAVGIDVATGRELRPGRSGRIR